MYSWGLCPAEAAFLSPWALPFPAPNPANRLVCLLETWEIMAGPTPPTLECTDQGWGWEP